MSERSFNPYAPPEADPNLVGARAQTRVEGACLVLEDATLPDVCLKCGARERIVRREHRFVYQPPWVLLLVVFCTLIGIAAAAITTKRLKVSLPLCETCNRRWRASRILLVLPLVVFVGALALF